MMHNEALQRLDMLVAATVEEGPRTTPPAMPQVGSCYIVGAAATGDWVGKEGCIAGYSAGGWRTVSPRDGMVVYVRSTGVFATYRDGAWDVGPLHCSSLMVGGQQVVGSAAAAITAPVGGATVDAEARAAVAQILAALRSHGLIET